MKVTIESTKSLKSILKVVIEKKEIDQKIEKRLEELKKTVNLKGFRPGKAPIHLLKKQFGSAVYGEVVEKTLQQSTFDALKEKKITPANQPKIDLKSSGENKDLEFTISVEQVPKIEKIDFQKISLNKYEVKSEKKEIDERIKHIADNNKKYVEKKDKAIKDDLIVFDFVAKVNGQDFEGNKGEKLQIVLGKDLFVPGFDKQLEGAKAGDERAAKVKLPDNYPKKELAGKEAEFMCKILEVKKGENQKIDDTFAKNMGAKNLKDLEDMISKQISREFDNISGQLLKKEILDTLDNKYNFELPSSLVDDEIKNVENSFVHEKMNKLKAKGQKFEHNHDNIKLDDADKKSVSAIAKRRVKLALLLNKTGEENQIKVSQDELKFELENQLKNYPGQEKTIRDFYQKNPNELVKLRGPVFEDKVIELIKSKATISSKVLSKDKLIELFNKEESSGSKKQAKPSSKSKPETKAKAKKLTIKTKTKKTSSTKTSSKK